jgi:hypothetical protein
MVKDPGLHVTRRGRTILFTEQQLTRVIQALQWRCTSANRPLGFEPVLEIP